ncbi:hypothetical protein O6H91_03G067400 [Diphasiastrum complanatum]|uniref:Uncharacterized protein n=1 Tax=Diphasiastrum complanatum TaxID=34168 RepID=A0ACC2E7Z6_DIPCM|nr:hypothetical protein O6H91_03G067400 [Diphasiastrum complanatum]
MILVKTSKLGDIKLLLSPKQGFIENILNNALFVILLEQSNFLKRCLTSDNFYFTCTTERFTNKKKCENCTQPMKCSFNTVLSACKHYGQGCPGFPLESAKVVNHPCSTTSKNGQAILFVLQGSKALYLQPRVKHNLWIFL